MAYDHSTHAAAFTLQLYRCTHPGIHSAAIMPSPSSIIIRRTHPSSCSQYLRAQARADAPVCVSALICSRSVVYTRSCARVPESSERRAALFDHARARGQRTSCETERGAGGCGAEQAAAATVTAATVKALPPSLPPSLPLSLSLPPSLSVPQPPSLPLPLPLSLPPSLPPPSVPPSPCLPACLPASGCMPAYWPACVAACLPACLLPAKAALAGKRQAGRPFLACGRPKIYIPHLIIYTHHLIFYVPHLIFCVPHLQFYIPPQIFFVPLQDFTRKGGFCSTIHHTRLQGPC